MKKNILLLTLISLSAVSCFKNTITGVEIGDLFIPVEYNLGGKILDSNTGKGIAGVAVTDGYTYTITDADGIYFLVADETSGYVYYSLPSGYASPHESGTPGRPVFWDVPDYSEGATRVDFELEPVSADEYRFVAVGGLNCSSTDELTDWANNTLLDVEKEVSTTSHAYAIALGALGGSDASLWGDIQDVLSHASARSGSYINFYACKGSADSAFADYYGPANYSLNLGNTHFVVMDNASGFSDSQLSWLDDDLKNVNGYTTKTVVLCVAKPILDESAQGSASALDMLCRYSHAYIFSSASGETYEYEHSAHTALAGGSVMEYVYAYGDFERWTVK